MQKHLSIMNQQTKLKYIGIIALAFVSSIFASIWPGKLGELYTNIASGTTGTIVRGFVAIMTFGLICLASECITIARSVFLDCVIASYESEIRECSIEKLSKIPVSYYSRCLSGEKSAQMNQGVTGFSHLIKIMCNDIFATFLITVFKHAVESTKSSLSKNMRITATYQKAREFGQKSVVNSFYRCVMWFVFGEIGNNT